MEGGGGARERRPEPGKTQKDCNARPSGSTRIHVKKMEKFKSPKKKKKTTVFEGQCCISVLGNNRREMSGERGGGERRRMEGKNETNE